MVSDVSESDKQITSKLSNQVIPSHEESDRGNANIKVPAIEVERVDTMNTMTTGLNNSNIIA